MLSKTEVTNQLRITLTEQITNKFLQNISNGNISEFAAERRLSYALIYNLAHGRIRSISVSDYKRIFKEEPPYQEIKRVDGEYFRGIVRLWLYLNEDMTEAGLYREFYPGKKFNAVDYRIFNGEVNTIEARLEKTMEKKFLKNGFQRSEIKKWIEDLDLIEDKKRVPYEKIKPIFDYLRINLGINPTRILNQSFVRYESGELMTVPKTIYDYALTLKIKTEEALHSGSRYEIEKLREEVYGKREGLTLYSEVEGEIEFLRKYEGKSPKKYLGRSITHYKKSNLKRIASRRARKIRSDCNELIRRRPEINLLLIPKTALRMKSAKLFFILNLYLKEKLIEDRSETFERDLLTPNEYSVKEYDSKKYGSTGMDDAAFVLGLSKKAFDFMVAAHSDIFRRIGTYEKRWFLPNLYLKEIMEDERFHLLKTKYELLAKKAGNGSRSAQRIGEKARFSNKNGSRREILQNQQGFREPVNHAKDGGAFILHERSVHCQQIAFDLS